MSGHNIYRMDQTTSEHEDELVEELLEDIPESKPSDEPQLNTSTTESQPIEFGVPRPGVTYREDKPKRKFIPYGIAALLGLITLSGALYVYVSQKDSGSSWITLKFDDALQSISGAENLSISGTTEPDQTSVAHEETPYGALLNEISPKAKEVVERAQSLALTKAGYTTTDPQSLGLVAGNETYTTLIDAEAPEEVANAAAHDILNKTLKDNSVGKTEIAGVHAHLNALLDPATADMNDKERLMYVSDVVTSAVESANGSVDDQISITHKSLDTEAKLRNMPVDIVVEEKARVWDSIEAKSQQVYATAAATENRQSTSIAQPSNMSSSDANSPSQQPVGVAGNMGNQRTMQEHYNSADYAKEINKPSIRETSYLRQDAYSKASIAADKLGLRGVERDQFIAIEAAKIEAESLGLSKLEIELAGVRAEAYLHAKKIGLSDINAKNYADNEAVTYMQTKGVPADMQLHINNRVAASLPVIGIESSYYGSSLTQNVNLHPTDAALENRVGRLESTLTSLSGQVAETNKMIIELAQSQLKTQSEMQAKMQNNSQQLASFETRFKKLEAAPEVNRFDDMIDKLTGRTDKLEKNYHWTSNRLCEEEAASGNFKNEATCKSIFDRVRKEGKVVASAVVADNAVALGASAISSNNTNKSTRTKLVYPRTAARTDVEINSDIPKTNTATPLVDSSVPESYRRVLARMDAEKLNQPKTVSLPAPVTIQPEQAVIKPLPITEVRPAPVAVATVQAPKIEPMPVVVENVCARATKEFTTTMVSSNRAVIENKWGATRRLVTGSQIDGLGSVKAFIPGDQPRVVFTNGIVCGK